MNVRDYRADYLALERSYSDTGIFARTSRTSPAWAPAEDNAVFAPGSRRIAYQSNETGRQEIYVEPFPATGAKYRISRDGGTQPMWRRDGKELFFLAPNGDLMAAPITLEPYVQADSPHALFASGTDPTVGTLRHTYAVGRDGQRFLLNVPERDSPGTITVIVNWSESTAR